MRQFRVLVNGNEYKVAIEEIAEGADSGETSAPPPKAAASSPKPPAAEKKAAPAAPLKQEASSNGQGNVKAAMPGTILDIKVAVGDTVTKGQPLLVLEAMKMENDVMAPHDGEVKEIYISKGASVNSGDALMVIA